MHRQLTVSLALAFLAACATPSARERGADTVEIQLAFEPPGICRASLRGQDFALDADEDAISGALRLLAKTSPNASVAGGVGIPYKCLGYAIWLAQRAGFVRVGFISEPPPGLPEAFAADATGRVPGEKGLWMGPIHLCRDNVAVRSVVDPTGTPALLLTFSPEVQPRLRQEIGRQVDRQMTVRVDGRTLMAAYVQEPIAGLEMQLHGPDPKARKAVARAAKRRCRPS